MKLFFKKIKNLFLKQEGQSLIEIVIALAIGAILIGGASTAVVVVLQSSKTSQIQQSATALAQGLVENVRVYAFSDWSNVYDLNKTSSTVYFMHSSSTDNFHLEGEEGIVDNGIQSGLAGHWKLDSVTGSTAYDFSGNDNDGVLNNGVLQATSSVCWVGGCLGFDGMDDYVNAGNDESLDITEELTVLAWVKFDHLDYSSSTGGLLGIAGKGHPDSSEPHDGWWFNYDNRNNNDSFNYTCFGNTEGGYAGGGNNFGDSSHDYVFNTNEWYYLGFTINSTEGKLYINGSQHGITVDISNLSLSDTSKNLAIGQDSSGHEFNGKIDDVRIYNRALTSDEVDSLYDSTMFDRYFYVENVCRTNDANYEIGGVAPCGAGEVLDPLTQKITGVIEWPGKEEETSFSLSEYITRWKNDVFTQSDWSGGEGLDGPVTDYTDSFSSSTGINYSDLGEIKIEGF